MTQTLTGRRRPRLVAARDIDPEHDVRRAPQRPPRLVAAAARATPTAGRGRLGRPVAHGARAATSSARPTSCSATTSAATRWPAPTTSSQGASTTRGRASTDSDGQPARPGQVRQPDPAAVGRGRRRPRRADGPGRRSCWPTSATRPACRPSSAYGTLLGAVRNGRLIGHDNDLDIAYLSQQRLPRRRRPRGLPGRAGAARRGLDRPPRLRRPAERAASGWRTARRASSTSSPRTGWRACSTCPPTPASGCPARRSCR